MTAETENQIQLSDGHAVGYAEYGDLQGKPVMHLHGLPSSRFEVSNPDLIEIATRLRAHIIVPDRPGIGLSDWRPYTIASYPDLVFEFADKLGLDRFPVLGYSSGGKFAVACAWKIPQRLTAALVVAGSCPFDLPGARAALSKQDRQIYSTADKMPWLFRLMLWKIARDARKNPESVLSLFTDISEPDKKTLAHPSVKRTLGQMVVGSFQQGTRGAAHDWQIEARPWRFSLNEIKMPVDIWHGEDDKIASIGQARLLAQAIPNAHAKFYPNEGHTLFVNRFEEILGALL